MRVTCRRNTAFKPLRVETKLHFKQLIIIKENTTFIYRNITTGFRTERLIPIG